MMRLVPPGFERGPVQGRTIIGEVTEALHKFLLDGWDLDAPPPRIEEDLSFVPKDREEVIYVYMYRVAQNTALRNSKRWRQAKITTPDAQNPEANALYYERAPLYLDLYYLIAVHSKFRSDAERLSGWVMLRLHEATHLIYRPRRYVLPDGRSVDSTGAEWSMETVGEDVIMEKVSLGLVDDLTVGDAINFFTIHEAPYRPFLTYQARCALEGSLISAPPTEVRVPRLDPANAPGGEGERPSGRIGGLPPRSARERIPFGPQGFGARPIEDEENNDKED